LGVLAVSSSFGKGSGKQAGCPTKHAPDMWDSAAFSSIFYALSFPYFQAESTPAHTAAPGCDDLRTIRLPLILYG
jgi:hypothetical protein